MAVAKKISLPLLDSTVMARDLLNPKFTIEKTIKISRKIHKRLYELQNKNKNQTNGQWIKSCL